MLDIVSRALYPLETCISFEPLLAQTSCRLFHRSSPNGISGAPIIFPAISFFPAAVRTPEKRFSFQLCCNGSSLCAKNQPRLTNQSTDWPDELYILILGPSEGNLWRTKRKREISLRKVQEALENHSRDARAAVTNS